MAKRHCDVVPISELSPTSVSVNDGSIRPSITVDGNLGSLRILSDSGAARPGAGAQMLVVVLYVTLKMTDNGMLTT